jgi:hypothetical protein
MGRLIYWGQVFSGSRGSSIAGRAFRQQVIKRTGKGKKIESRVRQQLMDEGIEIERMTVPATVPIQNPQVNQGKIRLLQQDPRRAPQLFHDQSLLLLPAADKINNPGWPNPA